MLSFCSCGLCWVSFRKEQHHWVGPTWTIQVLRIPFCECLQRWLRVNSIHNCVCWKYEAEIRGNEFSNGTTCWTRIVKPRKDDDTNEWKVTTIRIDNIPHWIISIRWRKQFRAGSGLLLLQSVPQFTEPRLLLHVFLLSTLLVGR